MNKKATDKIISIYWFTVLFIIASAVIYMVVLFYGEPFDVRKLEADILVNKIADCIAQGGYLKPEIYKGKNFLINQENLSEVCDLNFETEDFENWALQGQYYLELDISDFVSGGSVLENGLIKLGNSNLKENCGKFRNFPQCKHRTFYSLYERGDRQFPYKVNILASVRKTEKNK